MVGWSINNQMRSFIDIFVYFFLILAGILGSYLAIKISKENLFIGYAAISGILTTILWMFILKYSRNNVASISGCFDGISTLSYYMGFIVFGQQMSISQYVGGLLIIVGIFIINQ